VPLRLLSDPADYFERVARLGDPVFLQRAKLLFERFQGYMVAIVTLGDMPINDVGPVFERINRTGTRLDIVDLMRAASASTSERHFRGPTTRNSTTSSHRRTLPSRAYPQSV